MRKRILLILASLTIILVFGWFFNRDKAPIEQTYLDLVLNNLDQIKTAKYVSTQSAYHVYDTITPVYLLDYYYKEYVNPADTFVGAGYVRLNFEDSTKMDFCYDGHMRARVHWEEKTMEIDSFKTNRFMHRPVWAPFFTRARTILNYIIDTEDSISFSVQDHGNTLRFDLTVFDEDTTVEFMGNRTIYHKVYQEFYEPDFSRYSLWVNKSDYLPFKIKRDLPHSISIEETRDVILNKDDLDDFIASSYFPDYPLRKHKKKASTHELVGKSAPDWALFDPVNQETVSLSDLANKVILLEFTGIGCGPCYAAVPFLKQLAEEYKNKDFQLVSIECWGRNDDRMANYKKKNQLNYRFLKSDKLIESLYRVNSVPQFILLDQNRTIVHFISGYSKRTTGQEIREKIDQLL